MAGRPERRQVEAAGGKRERVRTAPSPTSRPSSVALHHSLNIWAPLARCHSVRRWGGARRRAGWEE